MTHLRPEQFDVSDTSLEAMQARLTILQPSLEAVMDKALGLFDDTYDQAPHPADVPESPVYAVHTADMCPVEGIPTGRELTIVLGAGKWVRVFRNTDSSPNSYARKRLWLWRPEGELSRKIDLMRTHNPRRVEIPFDIDTTDYDNRGRCTNLVGFGYVQQEPFVAEVDEALDNARIIAADSGFIPR